VIGVFEFPSIVKYPTIPCYIDNTTTVYPLSGACLLKGPEDLVALRQGCKIDINSAFYRHPKEKLNINTNKYDLIKPFNASIKDIQD
jgi:hypothetical protein